MSSVHRVMAVESQITLSRARGPSPADDNEGSPADWNVSHHLKQTVLKNEDGTVSLREEESRKPD